MKGQDHLKQASISHFQILFQEDGLSDGAISAEFLDNVPSLVSIEDNFDLMKPFTEKEIMDVIWAMESDKAHGTVGFSFHFYRVYWNIIKSDMICMVTAFQKKV